MAQIPWVDWAGAARRNLLWCRPDKPKGPVAQLDRALPSEGKGHAFESRRVRQKKSPRKGGFSFLGLFFFFRFDKGRVLSHGWVVRVRPTDSLLYAH